MYNRVQKAAAWLVTAALCLIPLTVSAGASEAETGETPAMETVTVTETLKDSPAPISAGYLHSAVIRSDGSLWMAGANTYGQLGKSTDDPAFLRTETADGVEISSTEFVQVMENVKAVYCGYLNTFAIDGNDTLWVWGWNEGGQLGLGDKVTRFEPAPLLNDIVMAAPGDYHSAAVGLDGTLWTWGWNVSGQLGNGTNADLYVPKEVLDDVRWVAVGLKHTMAVKNDNTLWACGDNTYGQLADGTKEDKNTFEKVMDNVESVTATAFGTLILKTDGSLWTCGYNKSGEMGNGTYEDVTEPERILRSVRQTAASREFSAAIDDDGVLYAWGLNNYGQYGGSPSEVPLEMDKGVSYVSAGGGHLMYLKDSTVYACGNNQRGQFGVGNTNNAATPLSVFENVAVIPATVRNSKGSGPVIAAVSLGVLAAAAFAFLIVRTLRGKPKKKTPAPEAPKAQEAPKTAEEKMSQMSDAELLKMAEAMNAAAAGEEPEEDEKE